LSGLAIGSGRLLYGESITMCGICGFTGEQDEVILKRMTDSIYHRGPDDDGFFVDGKINLGIRRLSIIDVKTGQQPIHNENKNLWTVFNGEIYNFQAIRTDLEGKGHRFYTDHSDTEVIVHLYEEYGRDFTHQINGMFALALWDRQEEKLLLIRDRMGVKPLFYALVGGKLIFGSEIKAILQHPAYTRDINYDALYHYFTLKNIPAPMTAFAGINSLLPGERLVFSKGQISKERWWKIRFNESEGYDEHDIQKKILDLLDNATRLRMISDVPFGAYLSGGVDSSAVVALMSRYSNQPIKTFSLGYEDELKNKEADLYYARKVSQTYRTEHHEYIMSHNELIDDIEDVITSFDQPFSGTIATYFLSKLIRKHVKVALSGDAADELFGSYLSHRIAQPMAQFRRLYDEVQNGTLSDDDKQALRPCDIPFLDDLYHKSGGDDVRWRYHLGVFSDEQKRDLLSGDFLTHLKGISSYSLFAENFQNTTTLDPLNRILEMEWNTQLPDQVLAFIDFLSMAHSVEVRSPFLDYRLVEFVSTIPGRLKIKNGTVKDILKRTVEPLLPAGIAERPKEGFVLPIFDWMVEKLEGYSRDVLSDERLNKHNLFNKEEVENILRCYYNGHRENAVKIWNLMMFQIWWERYFG
jgi:asparagine synthase (glutamine-hydrolysing)